MSWRELLRPGLADLEAYRVTRPEGYVYLDANESPFPPSEALRRELADRVAALDLNRYPDVSGAPLREALAERLEVDPDAVIVGNGSDEILSMLLTAFAAPRAGREAPGVAYPVPTFSMYGIHARTVGAEPVPLPTGPRFEVDQAAILGRLREARPNLLFLARPNNPTGTLWPRDLVAAAAEDEDLVVVVDEAYGDFAGETCLELARERPNVVVMRTLSKIGFAGLRVGWCVARPEVARELDKVRLPYNLDAVAVALATHVVRRWDALVAPAVAEVVRERGRLSAALAGVGLEVFESRANLVLVRTADPDGIFQGLKDRGILVRDLHRPGTPLEGCLRITVGTPDENDRLLDALGEILP